MYCKYCGTKIQDNEMNCSQCNHQVNRGTQITPVHTEELKPVMPVHRVEQSSITPVNVTEQKSDAPINRADQKPVKWEMDSPYGEIKDNRAIKTTQKHSRRSVGIGLATIALIVVFVLLINSLSGVKEIIMSKKDTSMVGGVSIDRPNLETMLTASPFYAPDLVLPSKVGKEHRENVKNKIEEILRVTDEMMISYAGMKQEVFDNIIRIQVILAKIDEVHGTNYLENSQVLKELEQLVAEFELQELKYYGLDIDETKEALYDSDIAFARVAAAMTSCEKVTEAYQLLINYSANIFIAYEADTDPNIQIFINMLEDVNVEDPEKEYAPTLMAGVDTVNQLLLELDAANAYLALSNLEYMGNELDQVKDDIEEMKDSDLVDDEFIELSELMVEEYEEMQAALTQELEWYVGSLDLDMAYYENTESKFRFFNPIIAEASSDKYSYGAGYDVQMLQKKGQEYMQAQRKEYQEKYKDESYWQTTVRTAKEVRKGTQDIVEGWDAATFELMRSAAGRFTPSLGNKEEDAYKDIQDRYALAKKRKEEGKGGQDVFKVAVKGFQATQDMAGEGWYNIAAFWEDELGLPEDSVAQVASGMGNLAAESFTQFGQGLARILDPDAKDSDIAKGCLEVATSMVGGSSNIFSATKNGGKVLVKMGEIIANPKISAKGVIDAVKAIKNIGLPQLGSLKYKDAAIKGTMAALKKTKQVAGSMIDKLDETFTKEISGIFTQNWKESLAGLRDYANKVGSNVDDSAVKLIDEFVNGYIDNKVTELASHPWLWDPDISEEEKEAKLGEEIDKMNEEVEQGLSDIETNIEESILNGKYTGSWSILTIEYYDGIEDPEEWLPILELYQESIGVEYPCTFNIMGGEMQMDMSLDKELLMNPNSTDKNDVIRKKIEIDTKKGEILGYRVPPNNDVSITSKATKEKTVIEGTYYYTVSFSDEYSPNFKVSKSDPYVVTISFRVEKYN